MLYNRPDHLILMLNEQSKQSLINSQRATEHGLTPIDRVIQTHKNPLVYVPEKPIVSSFKVSDTFYLQNQSKVEQILNEKA